MCSSDLIFFFLFDIGKWCPNIWPKLFHLLPMRHHGNPINQYCGGLNLGLPGLRHTPNLGAHHLGAPMGSGCPCLDKVLILVCVSCSLRL